MKCVRVGQNFLAFQGRTVENARYGDLNSDIPVYRQTALNKSCVFIDGPVTGLDNFKGCVGICWGTQAGIGRGGVEAS